MERLIFTKKIPNKLKRPKPSNVAFHTFWRSVLSQVLLTRAPWLLGCRLDPCKDKNHIERYTETLQKILVFAPCGFFDL